jgi:menaquinone-dependent protoporphyrinogen oxidase
MKTIDRLFHVFCLCAALMAAVCMFAGSAQAKPRTASDNITQSCGLDNATKTILIAYDTIHGCTAGVAARIGDTLCNMGFKVDVKWVGDVTDVDDYDGFIVGSAIYKFSWLPDAQAFLEKYKDQLAAKKTALFIDGASMSQDTPETRAAVKKSFIDPVLENHPEIHPVTIGLFGGAFDLTRKNEYNLFEKIVLRILGIVLRLPDKKKADWSNGTTPTIEDWSVEAGNAMK